MGGKGIGKKAVSWEAEKGDSDVRVMKAGGEAG